MANYFHDPSWLPYSCDLQRGEITFAHVPREAHRSVIFLDPRYLGRSAKSPPVPLSETSMSDATTGRVHCIFHTAFCCSTLMTRALDVPGVSMGLKEPSVLLAFSDHWTASPHDEAPSAALKSILDLLSRPFAAHEVQVVKPSNALNHAAERMLRARPDMNLLLMHSDLQAFLRAVVRGRKIGRHFARNLFSKFSRSIPLPVMLPSDGQALLSDLQLAAQAWLMQAALFDSLERKFPDRVRTLSADAFLADPPGALERLGAFFDLQAHDWEAVARGPVFATHAKQPGRSFDAVEYRRKAERTEPGNDAEIAEILRRAASLAKACGSPMVLGDSLMQKYS